VRCKAVLVLDKLRDFAEKLTRTTRVHYSEDYTEMEPQDYIEVEPEKSKAGAKIYVKYFVIKDYADIKPLLDRVREGYSIIFAKVKALRTKDMTELKRVITKIKRTCEAVGGDILGIDEDYIVIVPSFAKVSKEDLE
jgi:SepF-like predicted cell division protein (DUF552 family)